MDWYPIRWNGFPIMIIWRGNNNIDGRLQAGGLVVPVATSSDEKKAASTIITMGPQHLGSKLGNLEQHAHAGTYP